MSNWSDIACYNAEADGPCVLVTVGRIKGSTPRDSGANMLVTPTKTYGTIGGGRLEYLAIDKARKLIDTDEERAEILTLPLGPELAQCCGGYVEILLSQLSKNEAQSLINRLKNINENSLLVSRWSRNECRQQIVTASDSTVYLDKPLQAAINRRLQTPGFEIIEHGSREGADFTLVQSLYEAEFHVTLFGAGHVGRAVITALAPLPCRIHWVDEREREFPKEIPHNVTKIVTENPASAIADSPAGSYFLVMTHSHQLDLEICEKLLSLRTDAAFIGLIGSQTKKTKFEKRLATMGFDASTIARIICPIGLPGLDGKRPAEIALSVATDLLLRHRKAGENTIPVRQDVR